MGLSGWNADNKLKLTIDGSKIDGDIADFPVLITLSSGSGQTGYDATAVFDELSTGIVSSGVILLHCDDDLTDYSSSNHVPVISGSINNSYYKFGSGSMSSQTDYADSVDWDFGTEDFTIDWWMYKTATFGAGKDVFSSNRLGATSWIIHPTSSTFYLYHNGSNIFSPSYTEVLDIWQHWALVRQGDNIYAFIDGIQQGSTSTGHAARSIDGSAYLRICGDSVDPPAYMDEINIVKGTAMWTSGFIPPTGPHGSSWDNRKKIAVTTTVTGVETELYVEIERWESVTSSGIEQAWLWTKVPTIASGVDTELYLYYDSNHTTNSGYVGDTGETPAQNVWDSNFIGVWHMAQDPNGDVSNCILDSTSSGNDGTPAGTMLTEDLVDSKIGKGIDFDGTDDRIVTSFARPTEKLTLECLFNVEDSGSSYEALLGADANQRSWQWRIEVTTSKVNFIPFIGGAPVNVTGDTSVRIGYHYSAVTYDNGVCETYLDGFSDRATYNGAGVLTAGTGIAIGCRGPEQPSEPLDGIVDESRISNIDRSSAWIKATYYSNWDNLITYGIGEVVLSFAFTNPVPTHLSTVYGTSHTLQLTTTLSGEELNYTYDAVFYDASDDSQIGSTVSGLDSGQTSSTTIQTPVATDYSWYITATSSGENGTSSTYTFTNKFLCSGTTEINSVLTADVPVRLYRRSNGALIGSTTSISGGLFEIESTYNENHYCVALFTSSGTNALIYDYLKPGE